LFSDINMTGMDGEELARAAVAVRPRLRVILTSGAPRATIAAAFVPKPYRAADLVDVIGSDIMNTDV
jgi:FixJ family two-component response regulator